MTRLRYHAGQLEVQAEANSRALADRMADWVGPAGEFAERADLLVFAFGGPEGALRFAVVSGAGPLATIEGASAVRIAAAHAQQFKPGRIGGLAINLAEARRVRLNGNLQLDAHGALLEVDEAFTLCRKYLVRSLALETRVHVGPEGTEAITFDDPWLAELLQKAETSFMATAAPDGSPDVAHRGGPAGFLAFDAASRTLAWPEYLGDGVFKSAGNVRGTGRLALLVPDLESGDAAVFSGRGTYTNERRLREERRDPLLQHRDPFPVQGRIECRVDETLRLRGLMHPRRSDLERVALNSSSAVHEQAPQ